ncbi:MAG: hypothetical protein O7G13_16225 [Alphaproteobacteria bacterium]|nr:hypothetical protein [Alphaproteobacteria bacterium]
MLVEQASHKKTPQEGEWWHRKRILYEQIYGKNERSGYREPIDYKEETQEGESPSWSAALAKETGEIGGDRKSIEAGF